MSPCRYLFGPGVALLSLVVCSCGSRTGLLLPENADLSVGGSEAHALDAGDTDAVPPLNVTRPRDLVSGCPTGATTLVYVITTTGNLMSFFPPAASFTAIGRIACPAPADYKPFSMAVDRTGVAYVLFTYQPSVGTAGPNAGPGELFRVSTGTAACRATGFVAGQQGFSPTFGMGFSADSAGTGETLYVASNESGGGASSAAPLARLARIDTGTFALHVVGTFPSNVNRAELTGTGAGDLFAFYASGAGNPPTDSVIGQVDKATARVTGQSLLAGVEQGMGWAFAFWGGDFYTFTAPSTESGSTIVTRFRPADGSLVQVARTSDTVVGAGVSICAPQQ